MVFIETATWQRRASAAPPSRKGDAWATRPGGPEARRFRGRRVARRARPSPPGLPLPAIDAGRGGEGLRGAFRRPGASPGDLFADRWKAGFRRLLTQVGPPERDAAESQRVFMADSALSFRGEANKASSKDRPNSYCLNLYAPLLKFVVKFPKRNSFFFLKKKKDIKKRI